MTTRSILQTAEYQTIDELIEQLHVMKTSGTNYLRVDGDMIDCFSLHLIEDTLSDGSIAYDVSLNITK